MAGERDLLGAQLVRRNDELALLYHKTRLQQSALAQVMPRAGLMHQGATTPHRCVAVSGWLFLPADVARGSLTHQLRRGQMSQLRMLSRHGFVTTVHVCGRHSGIHFCSGCARAGWITSDSRWCSQLAALAGPCGIPRPPGSDAAAAPGPGGRAARAAPAAHGRRQRRRPAPRGMLHLLIRAHRVLP